MLSSNYSMSIWDLRLCPPFGRENLEEFRMLFPIGNGSRFEARKIGFQKSHFGHFYEEFFFTSWFFLLSGKECCKHLSLFYWIVFTCNKCEIRSLLTATLQTQGRNSKCDEGTEALFEFSNLSTTKGNVTTTENRAPEDTYQTLSPHCASWHLYQHHSSPEFPGFLATI